MYDRLVWEVWMPFLRSAVWYDSVNTLRAIYRLNLYNSTLSLVIRETSVLIVSQRFPFDQKFQFECREIPLAKSSLQNS